MEDLLKINDKIEEIYNKILEKKLEIEIDSPLMDDFNIVLDEFVTLGRKIFNDNTLSYEDLRKNVYNYAIKVVQAILKEKKQKALDKLLTSSRTVQKVMEKLEFVLANSNNSEESAEFLRHFSEQQIVSLRALQEYIRSIF